MRLLTVILAVLVTLGFLTGPSDAIKWSRLNIFKRRPSTSSTRTVTGTEIVPSNYFSQRTSPVSRSQSSAGHRGSFLDRNPWTAKFGSGLLGVMGLAGVGAATGAAQAAVGGHYNLMAQDRGAQQQADLLNQRLAFDRAQNDRMFEYQKQQDELTRNLAQTFRNEDREDLKKTQEIAALRAQLLAQQAKTNELLALLGPEGSLTK